ncbi:MAG TPA: hypothetical protein VII75_11105 [Thermoanaerobaculia bacterium]|nr:hypothetical protein [Thermoanaerobaculia bacterium]
MKLLDERAELCRGPTGAGGIVFKALFQPSRTPLSSYGVGIGFRSSQVKIGSFQLDKLTGVMSSPPQKKPPARAVMLDGTPLAWACGESTLRLFGTRTRTQLRALAAHFLRREVVSRQP